MLEIILLVILTKRIGVLAEKKGLQPGVWKLYTVLAWIGAEIVGVTASMMIFGMEELFPAYLLGIGCAATSYFVILSFLNKKPNNLEEDINRISVNDLRP